MEPENAETTEEGTTPEKRPARCRVALAVILLATLIGTCLVAAAVASQPAEAPGKASPSRSQSPSAPSRQDGADGDAGGDGEVAPIAASEGGESDQATALGDAPGSLESREGGASTGEAREVGGSNGGSSSDPAPAPTPDPAPAPHEHSWTPVTSQQWVANNVWVEDSAAWDEPIYEQSERSICNGCGADITSDPWGHIKNAGRGSSCSGYHSEVTTIQTGTVHHDATGHYEDQGYYETVTTGYSCSCGAVK